MTKILVIDDDRVNAIMICRFLETQKYDCTHSQTSDDALALCANSHYELIITDYMLVNSLNGYELFKEIQKSGKHSKGILMSAHLDFEHATGNVLLDNPFHSFLNKPVDFSSLLSIVKLCLNKDD